MIGRRLIALAVSLVAGFAGVWLVAVGGGSAQMLAGQFVPSSDGTAYLLLGVAGALLIGIAAATVALSSLGVLVFGAANLVVGVLALIPPSTGTGGHPLITVLRGFRSDPALDVGVWSYAMSGTALLIGIAFVAAGLTVRSARRPDSTGVVVGVVGIIPALAAVVVLLLWAAPAVGRTWRVLQGDTLATIAMIVVAALFAAALISLRWSSVTAATVGTLVLLFGLVLVPQNIRMLFWASESTGYAPLREAITMFGSMLPVLLTALGMTLIGVAVGAAIRRSRKVAGTASAQVHGQQSWQQPPYGPTPPRP